MEKNKKVINEQYIKKKGEENHDLKTEDKKIITAGRLSKKDCK